MTGKLPDIPEERIQQERLFNVDRFSPATVAVMLRLPAGSTRDFMVASSLGKVLRSDHTFKPLRGKDGIASVVFKAQREAIMAGLGIKADRWRQLRAEWEHRGVAHRCHRDVLCLWFKPFENPCQYCGKEVLHDRADYYRQSGNHSHVPDGLLALSVPSSGDASPRDEQGDEGVQPSVSSEDKGRHQDVDLDAKHGDVEKKRAAALKRLENDPGYQAELAAREAR